jgi:HEAT repeat protein
MLFFMLVAVLLPPADEKFAAERVVEPFVKQLKDQRPSMRLRGLQGLAKLGGDAHPAIPEVIAALKDGNKDVRSAAASTLPRMGPKVIASLVEAMKDKNTEVRFLATLALGEVEPAHKDAIEMLIWALKYQSDLRVPAVVGLSRIGKPAISELTLALREKDAQARYHALWALANIGTDALEAVPEMMPLLTDKERDVRAKALFALIRIKPEALVGTGLLQPVGMW